MFASAAAPLSLCKRVRISVTAIFWLLALANIAVLIWSYYTTFLYVKLLIVIPDTTTYSDALHELASNLNTDSQLSLPTSFRVEITEFTLSFIDLVNVFWNGTAYTCALALIASMYIYPYFKLVVYCIVFLAPIKREYQHRAIFHLNQWNKVLFMPLVAVLLECATISFPLELPTQYLQEHTNVKAEAYPGHGMVVNLINLVCFYLVDHVLFFIINSRHQCMVRETKRMFAVKNDAASSVRNDEADDVDRDSRMAFVYKDYILRKYASTSYAGICAKSAFTALVIGNVWLNLEALHTATIRFKLQGVLALLIPDRIVINNVMQTAAILMNTSLLNDGIAWFIYIVYYAVFVICPCVVCALLAIIWILPLMYPRFAVQCTAKYALKVLWVIQSWNALDIYFLCQFGGTDHNIRSATKYLLDSSFPQYCGDQGLVTQIFGQDCSWADAYFTYGMFLVAATVLIQWFAVYYTNRVFSVDDYRRSNEDEISRKVSINT